MQIETIKPERRKKEKEGGEIAMLRYSSAAAFCCCLWIYVAKVERKDVNATLLYVQYNILVSERYYCYTPVGVRAYFRCSW